MERSAHVNTRSYINGDKLKQTLKRLTELEPLQFTYKASPNFNLDYLEVTTDSIFNSTVVELITELNAICRVALDKSEELLSLALNVTTTGSELATGMDDELPRVKLALKNLPCWDTWTLAHWLGESLTARYRLYLKFFGDEKYTFRTLVDASSAIHNNNLVGIREYCTWYTDDVSIHLINEDRGASFKSVTAQTIARNIESLLNRIQDLLEAGTPQGLPG
ncbi:hypothetical protein B0H19DRAFT_1267877 [Mycena capillaripes]|nr:hypothetical protein B0H19DRAFT_1267877 [Mycena capillaripes]